MSRRNRIALNVALLGSGLCALTGVAPADPAPNSSAASTTNPTTAPSDGHDDHRGPHGGGDGPRGDGLRGDNRPFIYGGGRSGGGGGGGPGGGNGGGPGAWRNQEDPTAEQWATISAFMSDNSKFRWSAYQKLETEHPNSNVLKVARKRIAFRVNDLLAKKETDADLYDLGIKQIQLEDQILENIDKVQRGSAAQDTDDKIDDSIKSWLDNQLAERQRRLDKLKQFVDRETTTLASDRAKLPDLLQDQRKRFDNEVKRMANPPLGDGDGPGGPPTSRPGN